MNKLPIAIAFFILTGTSCNRPGQTEASDKTWKEQVNEALPLLGHRNWILVVDKAFPTQNAPGMEYINTNDSLVSVLQYTLDKVDSSTHIKPIIFTDKELNYITEMESPGITHYRSRLKSIFETPGAHDLLHDSIFVKMAASSALFKVLVLKTNETLAYSSVFIQLDCAYWTAEKEKQLRNRMRESAK